MNINPTVVGDIIITHERTTWTKSNQEVSNWCFGGESRFACHPLRFDGEVYVWPQALLISFLSFRLASVLTVSLAALIKCVFIFVCACTLSTMTLLQKKNIAPNRVGVKAFKVTGAQPSPQQTRLTLGPWSPWSPCKTSRKTTVVSSYSSCMCTWEKVTNGTGRKL